MTTLLHSMLSSATMSIIIPQEWIPTVAYCMWLFLAILMSFASYDVKLTTTQQQAVTKRSARLTAIIGAVLVGIGTIVIVCGLLLWQWQAYTAVNLALTVISLALIVYKLCLWCAILSQFCPDSKSIHRRSIPIFAQLASGVIIFGAMYIVVLLSSGLQALLPFVVLAVVGSLSALYRHATRYTAVLTHIDNKPPFSLGSWAIRVCTGVSLLVLMLTQQQYQHYIYVGVLTATVSTILLDYYLLVLSIKVGKFDIICQPNPKLNTKTILSRARYLFVTALTLVTLGSVLGIVGATSNNNTLNTVAVIAVAVGFVGGIVAELLYVRWDINSTLMPNLDKTTDSTANGSARNTDTQVVDNHTTTITTDCIATDSSINRPYKSIMVNRHRVQIVCYVMFALYVVASIVHSLTIHYAVEHQLTVALNAVAYLTYFLFVLSSAILFCLYLPLTFAIFRLICTTAFALSLMWSITQSAECVLLWTTNQPINLYHLIGVVCMIIALCLLIVLLTNVTKRTQTATQPNKQQIDIFSTIQTNFSHSALTANPSRRIILERAFTLSIISIVVLMLSYVFANTLAEEKITAGIYISFGVGIVLFNVLNAFKLKLLGAHKLLFVVEHSLTTLALVLSCVWLVFGNTFALWTVILILDCMLPVVEDFVLVLVVRMTVKQNRPF